MVLHLGTRNVSKQIQYSFILKRQLTSQLWLTLYKLRPQHTSKYDSETAQETCERGEKKTQMQKNQWKPNGTNVLVPGPGPGTKTPSEVHVLTV